MRHEVRDSHKHKRVIRMDKTCRYGIICDKDKEINNSSKKQLEKFKSTLNRGRKKVEQIEE